TTPALLSADVAGGILEWAEAPGRSLYDLLHDHTVPVGVLAVAGRMTGNTLRALHDAAAPAGLSAHTAQDEIDSTTAWLRHAQTHHALPCEVHVRLDEAVAALRAAGAAAVPIHRDLHEKQVMIADGNVTVLDVDTIAVGEAAVDVANLLVHLDLRVTLGLPAERAEVTAQAFLDAYEPPPTVRRRLAAHATLTRIRLASLYAFRPRQAAAALRLIAGSCGSTRCCELGDETSASSGRTSLIARP
ncbi:MAG: phosphotransferase family protein, partial [Ilumatobacteraceae bacterium]